MYSRILPSDHLILARTNFIFPYLYCSNKPTTSKFHHFSAFSSVDTVTRFYSTAKACHGLCFLLGPLRTACLVWSSDCLRLLIIAGWRVSFGIETEQFMGEQKLLECLLGNLPRSSRLFWRLSFYCFSHYSNTFGQQYESQCFTSELRWIFLVRVRSKCMQCLAQASWIKVTQHAA